jgi:3-hydroxyacyl-[acyl-carrier-protein] dehydratase
MTWFTIDRLLECEAGKRAVATNLFLHSDALFVDHLPSLPIVPGALHIEMVAQTAGKCVKLAFPGNLTLLSTVRSARFLRPIAPGDQCRITATIQKLNSQYVFAVGDIYVGEQRVSTAELTLAIVPYPDPNNIAVDAVLEDWQQRQRSHA